MLTNTQHDIRFALCQVWSRSNPENLLFCTFCPKHSNRGISASIEDMSTIRCALHITYAAKYSANPLVYSVETLVLDKSNGLPTNRCAIYSTFAAKYRTRHPVCTLLNLV
ncbi:uncharacterized protein LOC122577501 [Bombus pyrosoma]|uniref:uncharacterized protein LOC122577501 n=1 Tax=Bombus pyrosoma TaxID=396416 RepID=UPI001CB94426|nr:uncharacterized protein LOC122577501 [Bombus pyrosoma]